MKALYINHETFAVETPVIIVDTITGEKEYGSISSNIGELPERLMAFAREKEVEAIYWGKGQLTSLENNEYLDFCHKFNFTDIPIYVESEL